ncbi:MAG: hypothetical protein AAGD25_39440, partial [Cyanobacteria bacterium P01_F01_bin.150]
MNTLSRTNLGLNQQTYQRLKAALRLNLRRQVFIGVCDNLVLRDRLAAQLQDDLLHRSNSTSMGNAVPTQAGHPRSQRQGSSIQSLRDYPRLVSLYLDINNPDPLAGVAQWLVQRRGNAKRQRLPMPAFQLLGVEQLSRQPATVQWLFLNYLQGIERSLPALDSSLLIWLPRPWARMIPQSAPDFWRCRTAIFEFAGDPTPLTFTISPEPSYSSASQGEWSTSTPTPASTPISAFTSTSTADNNASLIKKSVSDYPEEQAVQPSVDGDRPNILPSNVPPSNIPSSSPSSSPVSLSNYQDDFDDFDDFDTGLEDLVSTAEFPPEDSQLYEQEEEDIADADTISEADNISETDAVSDAPTFSPEDDLSDEPQELIQAQELEKVEQPEEIEASNISEQPEPLFYESTSESESFIPEVPTEELSENALPEAPSVENTLIENDLDTDDIDTDGAKPTNNNPTTISALNAAHNLIKNRDDDIVDGSEISIAELLASEIEDTEISEPLADQSLADQSLADQSLADQSLADQSLADQSLADQSLADQSLADQS